MLLLAAFLVIAAEALVMNFLRKSSKNREVLKAILFMTLLVALIIFVNIDDTERYNALKDSTIVPWTICGLLLVLIYIDYNMPNNPISVVFRAWNRTTSNLFFVMLILTVIAYSMTNWNKW